MITSASYATPRNPEPIYRELEPEYDRPATLAMTASSGMTRQPSSPERAYHVPEKNDDIVAPRGRHHHAVVGTRQDLNSSSTPGSSQDNDDGFYYDTSSDNNTTSTPIKQIKEIEC